MRGKSIRCALLPAAGGLVIGLAGIYPSYAANAVSNPEIRVKLREILARPEFAVGRWLTGRLESLAAWVERILSKVTGAPVKLLGGWGYLLLFVSFIGVCFLLFFIGSRLARTFAPEQAGPEMAEHELGRADETTLREEAARYAEAGEFREAIRRLYLSLLLFMDKQKWISFRLSKTNREYLREVKNAGAAALEFAGTISLYERKWYGMEQCDQKDYQEFRSLYSAFMREG